MGMSYIQIMAMKKKKVLWESLEPMVWYNAIYKNPTVWLKEIFLAEIEITKKLLSSGEKSSLIDVGCGTAELLAYCYPHCKYAIGFDINKKFLDKARELHPEFLRKNAFLVHGNALHLQKVLLKNMPQDFWKTERVVVLVMNTLGIIPETLRKGILKEMINLIGNDGILMLGCWNKNYFELGIEWYKRHPEICGELEAEDYDVENGTVKIHESGYESQWWSEETLKNLLEEYRGKYELLFIDKGVGIFAFLLPPNKRFNYENL